MRCDCHMHMVLDGVDWRAAIDRHKAGVDLTWVRKTLKNYQQQGFTYLRDGGDRWGVGAAAKKMAPEYGITYRTPLAPLCEKGHYGSFIGREFEDMREYIRLVEKVRWGGGDFVKIMLTGLMDFHSFGTLTEEGLPDWEVRELIHIAHQEGMAVMVHCNGARAVEEAAKAGADSVEHGAYLDKDALQAMRDNETVWVPTLSTIANLRGKGLYDDSVLEHFFENAKENVEAFAQMGGLLAPGSDAGAKEVFHAGLTEYALMEEILGETAAEVLNRGIAVIKEKF